MIRYEAQCLGKGPKNSRFFEGRLQGYCYGFFKEKKNKPKFMNSFKEHIRTYNGIFKCWDFLLRTSKDLLKTCSREVVRIH